MESQGRELEFDSFDQVLEDVQKLLANGYSASGKWNLAQACGHLNDWMRFPMDGYPKAPLPLRPLLWLMKVTVGRSQLERILADGFRAKTPTMPRTVPAADAMTDAAAVAQFAETIHRFKVFDGPVAPSPIFAEFTLEQARKLQLRHCAHHLSFLTPTV